ncbi:C40 family peptidase [Viridibacterium curvum]|uniref:NlpC/P60 domain-containing protein n=1 Tax=Viridibacterium curvum TaxID=1101404 RepID=A0ABP9QBJ1_9RHOO
MRRAWLPCVLAGLAACSSAPPVQHTTTPQSAAPRKQAPLERAPSTAAFRLDAEHQASEILLFSLSLLDTGYKFGGRNPEAGLDCSGMVSYVVEQVSGKRLPHNASQIAAITQVVDSQNLRPADLVFFNTNGKPYSHMGIYIGEGRFIHAPSSRGSVRVERLDNVYFAKRFDGARSLF